ncbi:hypothetical protein DSECCO2_34260 [anaerobic digester metagenome]|uniref:DUF4760 domain-containing protein n=2 Tax=Acetobacterium wieringae TaxID=52694 RepID=A0A5D0WLN5_9FIRM|nr:hypothetical protein [Acetobacterium wieringae]TYC84708.1 hypothetical protein FXB42_10225 [Acetobacterium wieringae]
MKAFKYSTIVTLILTVFSAIAIFAIDDVIPGMVSDTMKRHILDNMDNYNAFLFGIFTGSLVSLIVAIVGYVTERRRLIAEIWNNARKLTIDFRLLLLDNIEFAELTHEKLYATIEKQDFNQQVREWLGYHSSPYMINVMQLDFLINRGKKAAMLRALQENITILRAVVDGFMNAFLNRHLTEKYGDEDIDQLFDVITNQDEKQVLKTVQKLLDEIVTFLNKK